MALSITPENFEKEVLQSSKPVVIDVYATWCGPCHHMEPIFADLESRNEQTIKFAKLNVDDARDLAVSLKVSSVPTFIFIKDGAVQGRASGQMSEEDLTSKIEEHLGLTLNT